MKNTNIINKIWNIFYSIKELLKQKGIILLNIKDFNFIINFDLKKINKNSFAFTNNIDGLLFSVSKNFFPPNIILLRNNEITYIDEIFLNEKKLNSLFVCRELLKEIYCLIGIDNYILQDDYSKKATEEDEKIFNKIVKEFKKDPLNDVDDFKKNFLLLNFYMEIINNNIKIEKKLFNTFEYNQKEFIDICERNTTKYLAKKNILKENYKTLKSSYKNYATNVKTIKCNIEINNQEYLNNKKKLIKNVHKSMQLLKNHIEYINSINHELKEEFIFDTINFEKILFSEVFNIIPENITINNRIEFLKNIYILITNKIYDYLSFGLKNNIFYKIDDFVSNELKI